MLVTSSLAPDAGVTPEMKKEIEEAKKMPIVYDEDCPETTAEMAKQFMCAARMRNRLLAAKNQKQA